METLTGKQLGPYLVTAPLGEGGMAAVYQAFHPATERYVALKVLPRHFAQDEQFVARFRQEARVLAALQHPHILSVFDFGEADGYPYLVMPYIKGGTLARRLTEGTLTWAGVRRYAVELGGALHYAHLRGLVHRDVKPSNVLLDESDNSLLSDFGLAKMLAGSAALTTSGSILGTPEYMSPEQGMGQPLDARTDVYSLGVVLYEMAVGRPPYRAETPLAVVFKHVQDPLPIPRTVNPALPEALEPVLLKALAKAREERYQTAEALAQAVDAALTGVDGPLFAMPASRPAVFVAPRVIASPAGASPAAAPPAVSGISGTPAPAQPAASEHAPETVQVIAPDSTTQGASADVRTGGLGRGDTAGAPPSGARAVPIGGVAPVGGPSVPGTPFFPPGAPATGGATAGEAPGGSVPRRNGAWRWLAVLGVFLVVGLMIGVALGLNPPATPPVTTPLGSTSVPAATRTPVSEVIATVAATVAPTQATGDEGVFMPGFAEFVDDPVLVERIPLSQEGDNWAIYENTTWTRLPEGILVSAEPEWSAALIRQKQLAPGEGCLYQVSFQGDDTVEQIFELGISQDPWQDTQTKRLTVFLSGTRSATAGPDEVHAELTPEGGLNIATDRWHNVFMGITPQGEFVGVLWEPDAPQSFVRVVQTDVLLEAGYCYMKPVPGHDLGLRYFQDVTFTGVR